MVMARQAGPVKYPLDEAALYTMQYIVTAPVEKLYTFTVTEEVLGQVTKLIQYYMRQYVEKELKTLVFYGTNKLQDEGKPVKINKLW